MAEKMYRLEENMACHDGTRKWRQHLRIDYDMDLATACRTLGEMRGISPSKEYRIVEVPEVTYDDPF